MSLLRGGNTPRLTPSYLPSGFQSILALWKTSQNERALTLAIRSRTIALATGRMAARLCGIQKLEIMKSEPLVITFLFVVALAVGCNKKQTPSEQMDKVKNETTTAAQDMKSYTYAQKSDFVTTMQEQLDTLNKDMDQLSAKIESSSDTVKAEAKPKLQALRDQSAQLTRQLDNVRSATESTWDSVKATSQKALDSLKDGYQQSRQWVSDKIAP